METRNPLDILRWAEAELKKADIVTARYDAEELFMDSFETAKSDIYMASRFYPKISQMKKFTAGVKLRASRYPLQYIINNVEFMGTPLGLDQGVFIPRPDTEILVERVIDKARSLNKKGINILEIGVGCGNIAISLTKNISGCKMIASDISDKALKNACKNIKIHKLSKLIRLIRSNLFDNISNIYHNHFDIILSNPPYIRKKDINGLEPEVLHEDPNALDGGLDGLYFYRQILARGIKFLKRGGGFAFEIGYDQSEQILKIIEKDNRLHNTSFYEDYAKIKRVVITELKRGGKKFG